MRPNRTGFTLIELLIVIVIIGILVVIAVPHLWDSRDRAIISAVKHDLKVLAIQQEAYFSDNFAYAADETLTDFVPSDGVLISVTYAQTDGWAATATHPSLGARQCGLFIGNATAADAPPATQQGVSECN